MKNVLRSFDFLFQMKSNLLSEAVSIETDSNKPNLPLKKIGKRPAPI